MVSFKQYLYSLEGAIVVNKNPKDEKHSDELPIRNLEVLKLLQGFASRKFVTDNFNWNYHYYILTDEGIKYLREYLGLPEDIVPATLKEPATRPTARIPGRKFDGDRKGGFNPEFKRERGDRPGGREGYRPRQSS